jgi:ketosteroid isomerase-like protein
MLSGEEVYPYKPKLFDTSKISSEEYKPYIYSIKFSGKEVKGLSAEGYVHAIQPYLEVLETDLVKLEYVPRTEKTSGYFYAVVRVTLHLKFKTDENEPDMDAHTVVVSAFGDGDSKEAKDPAALVRIVETRAMKRAVARALDLGAKDINRLINQKDDEDITEDETGTPIEREYSPGNKENAGSGTGKLAQAIKESRDRVAKFQQDKDAPAGRGNLAEGEPDW